jgi:uroporphyrinogen-III synthase
MKRILYLGTTPTHFSYEGNLIHYPVIKIVPKSADDPHVRQAFEQLTHYTHLIFTSKNTVQVFFQKMSELGMKKELLEKKFLIAIGKVTASYLKQQGIEANLVSTEETQEGIVAELQKLSLQDAYFFLPRSSRARPVLVRFFDEKKIRYVACDLYETLFQKLEPVPELSEIDEIIFTSPSTVEGFSKIFAHIPKRIELVAVGPVTQEALLQNLKREL